jgi:hypothetical protein
MFVENRAREVMNQLYEVKNKPLIFSCFVKRTPFDARSVTLAKYGH